MIQIPSSIQKIIEDEEAENEYLMIKWLRGKLVIPEVLVYEKNNGRSYLQRQFICCGK